jgi:acetyl esterase/lipase
VGGLDLDPVTAHADGDQVAALRLLERRGSGQPGQHGRLEGRAEGQQLQHVTVQPPETRPDQLDELRAQARPARPPPGATDHHLGVRMEFDPLRDEGIQYALRSLQAGGSVELHSYAGAFHGADQFADTAVGRRMGADLLAALGRGLRPAGAVERHRSADEVAPADLPPAGLRDPLGEVGLG